MALRKPLVISGGTVQQLQAADTLDVSAVAGGDVLSQTNDEAGAIVIGTVVYNDVANGVKKAIATGAATARVVGLVAAATITNGVAGMIQVNGVLSASTAQWDAVTGGSGGLIAGTDYYLSPTTAGLLTSTAPSTAGQYVVFIGRAVSTTDMNVAIDRAILL